LLYVVDALATETDLWGVVNNALAKLTEHIRYETEQGPESEDKQIEVLWTKYSQLRSTNLDKMIANDKFD
jgi:hypothetical protein